MNWIEQVTILDLLVKGLIIGVVVSAPLGPVGVLCIQRTLNKGRWYGFVTGLGAALSDIIYALITGYGMSFMDEFLMKHQVLLQIIGSIMLFVFGVFTEVAVLSGSLYLGKQLRTEDAHTVVDLLLHFLYVNSC